MMVGSLDLRPPPPLATARPGSPALGAAAPPSCQSLAGNCSSTGTAHSDPPPPTGRDSRRKTAAPAHRDESPRSKKGAVSGGGGDSGSCGDEQSSSSDESEQSTDSERSDEDAPVKRTTRHPPPHQRNTKRSRVVGRQWVAALSARSNQDGQRRFEERAARQMRAALARRAAPTPAPAPAHTHSTARARIPPGGVYARLEAEWRERHGQPRARTAGSARARPAPPAKYK